MSSVELVDLTENVEIIITTTIIIIIIIIEIVVFKIGKKK